MQSHLCEGTNHADKQGQRDKDMKPPDCYANHTYGKIVPFRWLVNDLIEFLYQDERIVRLADNRLTSPLCQIPLPCLILAQPWHGRPTGVARKPESTLE